MVVYRVGRASANPSAARWMLMRRLVSHREFAAQAVDIVVV